MVYQSMSTQQIEQYYLQNDAIYLAEISTFNKVDSDYSIQLDTYVIDEITYSDSRNDLKNFSGSFQKLYCFKYRHTAQLKTDVITQPRIQPDPCRATGPAFCGPHA